MTPALAYALGISGGPAFLAWLADVYFTTLQDGARLCRMWPPGVNKSPADASMCIQAAERAGIIQRVGYTCNPSLLAWVGTHFRGLHPSKREPHVQEVERTWAPGPDVSLLAAIATTSWEEIVQLGPAGGVWTGWPTEVLR